MPELVTEITNKHNLPIEVYNALCKNRYSADESETGQEPARVTDFSVSTLIAPIQQTTLRRRYTRCNSEDAIDRVWTLFGHIAHQLLEEHGSDDSITEKRFYMVILGKTISGQIDHYKDRKITDYKTTSAYKIIKQSFSDWQKQQNCYATLCEENGLEVDSLRIVAIIRDWSEGGYEKNYPEAPIVVIPLLKWSAGARLRYMTERVELLIQNEKLPDECLTKCTPEERWMQTKDWAWIVPGRKNAFKIFDSEEEGVAWQSMPGSERAPDGELVQRMHPPRRCLKYCNVSNLCFQHQQYLKENSNGKVEGQGDIPEQAEG